MQLNFVRSLSCILLVLICAPARAQDANLKPEQFMPFELVGVWHFTNSHGVKYGGDVRVKVASMNDTSVMRGVVSYDGRETNDKCGTRGIATDEPVSAEIRKSNDQYRISFNLKCLSGASPRPFNWILVCEGATCSQSTVAPNGAGAITLTEKR